MEHSSYELDKKLKEKLMQEASYRIQSNIPHSVIEWTQDFQVLCKHLALLQEGMNLYKEAYEDNQETFRKTLNDSFDENLHFSKKTREISQYIANMNKHINELTKQRDHYADRTARLEKILGS